MFKILQLVTPSLHYIFNKQHFAMSNLILFKMFQTTFQHINQSPCLLQMLRHFCCQQKEKKKKAFK